MTRASLISERRETEKPEYEQDRNGIMIHRNTSQAGFTMIEIMTVVFLIGLLASIALPNFIKTRTAAQKNVCINNLRKIDDAIQLWALEEKRGANAAVQFADISAYLKRTVLCPAGGQSFDDSYLISTVGTEPSCQKFPASHLIAFEVSLVVAPPAGGSSSAGSGSAGSSGAPGNSGHGNNGHGHGHGP